MPAVPPGSKILVTGANGFIAVWIVQQLLEDGFSVCGTVRSEVKAAYLRGLFKDYGARFETAIVDDITKEGVFDSLVQSSDAVVHAASPMDNTAVDPDDVITPTVCGVQSILRSAQAARSTLKRFVLMSSTSAVFMPSGYEDTKMLEVWDDNAWSDNVLEIVRAMGKDALGPYKYATAKVLGERTAWEFVQREKAESGLEWDLVTLCPSYVFGPIAHDVPTLEKLKGTTKDWYDHVVKVDLQGMMLTSFGYAWVDVRDLGRAFSLALTVPDAGGERFLISAGSFVWQQFVDIVHKLYPEKVPAGDPSFKLEESIYFAKFNAEKSRTILGLKYRSMEDTAKDATADLRNRDWL